MRLGEITFVSPKPIPEAALKAISERPTTLEANWDVELNDIADQVDSGHFNTIMVARPESEQPGIVDVNWIKGRVRRAFIMQQPDIDLQTVTTFRNVVDAILQRSVTGIARSDELLFDAATKICQATMY